MGMSVEDRFWNKVRLDPVGCWEWSGYRHHVWGYGHFNFHGKTENAQRVAWTLAEGVIPDGLMVLHKCDNPPCCRPSHLFLGTAKDNAVDMTQKGRNRYPHLSGEQKVQAKITAAIADDIRTSPKMGIDLAAHYGISKSLVSLIRLGKRWA